MKCALAVLLAASALVLSACATAPVDTRVDADTPVPDDLDNRTELSCSPGEELLLNSPSTLYTVTGPCDNITVEGSGLIVRAEAIGNLVLRGDELLVEAGVIEVVQISGQGSTVIAQSIATLTINGDRNTVSSDESIDDADVNGADNEVD